MHITEIVRSLQELELVNFQGHVLSYFEFHRHLNIITGTSNHGKSSIVRAILWATQNEPYGVDYLNWYKDEKEGVEAHLVFDTGTVGRVKRKNFNGYVLSTLSVDEDTFEALRGDVPIEVEAVHQLDRHNIRGQDDGYFMLQDSPGNVARMLNKKTGLDDIDKVNRISKEVLGEYKNKLTFTTEELKKNKQRQEYLSDIKSFEKQIHELDSLYEEFDRLEKVKNGMEKILANIFDIDIKIEDCNQVLKRQKDLDVLVKLLDKRLKLAANKTRLTLSITLIDRLDKDIKNLEFQMEKQPLINDINLLILERSEITKSWNDILFTTTRIKNLDRDIQIWEANIESHELAIQEEKDKLKKIDICSECGASKENWNLEILNNR